MRGKNNNSGAAFLTLLLSLKRCLFRHRIISVEVTKSHVRAHTAEQVAAREMEMTPLRVLVNPELSVEDYTTVQFAEGCASVRGITGLVDRYRSVSVSGQSWGGGGDRPSSARHSGRSPSRGRGLPPAILQSSVLVDDREGGRGERDSPLSPHPVTHVAVDDHLVSRPLATHQ